MAHHSAPEVQLHKLRLAAVATAALARRCGHPAPTREGKVNGLCDDCLLLDYHRRGTELAVWRMKMQEVVAALLKGLHHEALTIARAAAEPDD